MFKKYRIYLVVNNTLCWWGSYSKRGNALRYLAESGSGLRVLQVKDGEYSQWFTQCDGVVKEADEFTSRLLEHLEFVYYRGER